VGPVREKVENDGEMERDGEEIQELRSCVNDNNKVF
jgi:hypothetical protein